MVSSKEYVDWLYGIAYRGQPFFTGTANPPRGYKKQMRFKMRKLWRAYKREGN